MNKNPFVLPGFGQSGQLGQNPVMASMEMMRQAWEGLASSGGMDAAAMGRMMSVEEMDKRISDLRAVENWLRMNLSMLSSTIQGLEVQRATVSTLKSFVDTGMASMAASATDEPAAGGAPHTASPLEQVLGLKPGPGTAAKAPAAEPVPDTGADTQPTQADAGAQADQSDMVAAAASAAQGWWNLLQQQFQTLAAATAASAEGALADMAEAGKTAAAAATAGAEKPATPPAKAPRKTTTRAAAKTPKATKTVRKTTVRKTAAKTASARKTTR